MRHFLFVSILLLTSVSIARADAVQDLTTAYQEGLAAFRQERFASAADHFQKAVQLAPEVYGQGNHGPTNANTARLMKYLADCYQELFRLNEAQRLYDQAYAALVREEGADSNVALLCQDSLGLLYRKLSQWDRAENAYQKALAGLEDREQWAATATKLGYLYMNQDRHEQAKNFFRQALEVFQAQSGRAARLDAADCRHGLGMVAHRQGRLDEAETLFKRALNVREELLDASHRSVAQSQGMLAAVYSGKGRDDLAKPLLEQTIQAMRQFWRTDDHIDVAVEQHELALLLERQGQPQAAAQLLDRSRRAYRQYLLQTLSGLPQEEQLRFLEQERGRFMDAAAMATSHRQDQSVVEKSLEWTLNAKAMSQETLAQRELLARQAVANPQSADAASKLQKTRQKLAALAVSGNSDEQQRLREDLARREAELAQSLSMPGASGAAGGWIGASQVRQALPDNAALIEIVRLDRSTPSKSALAPLDASEADARYAAWVLPAGGAPPQLVSLGGSIAIEDNVKSLRKLVDGEEATDKLRNDPVQATKDANRALRNLSSRVLWPLLPHLQGASHWIISPDSDLWLVPWSALLLKDGAYVIEQKTISHVVSGRDLLAQAGKTPPLDYGVIMANPDFNLPAEQVDRAARQLPPTPRPDEFAQRGGDDLLVSVPRDWSALPGTRQEAEDIKQPIEQLVGGKVHLLQGGRALEPFVKRWMKRPRVAVLATHGYFLQNDPDRLTNPLLRCGLIFAGANRRNDQNAAGDDGVLTGMEVLQVDLRGTELVALSACDTGVGRVVDGEGVGGLRQAFHLAGAKGVVSTLWKAPDYYTAILMKSFWQAAKDGLPAADALRKAQRELIDQCKNDLDAAHPWLWASPALTIRN